MLYNSQETKSGLLIHSSERFDHNHDSQLILSCLGSYGIGIEERNWREVANISRGQFPGLVGYPFCVISIDYGFRFESWKATVPAIRKNPYLSQTPMIGWSQTNTAGYREPDSRARIVNFWDPPRTFFETAAQLQIISPNILTDLIQTIADHKLAA